MKIMAIFILLATWTLSSLGDETLSSETPIAQTTCPVMIGNPIDPSLYVDHEGQRIYFCCKMCVQTFNENPAAYLPNLQNSNITNDQSVEVEDHDHETDHVALSNTTRLIRFLGKFHPIAVHIPIALILMSALAEFLFLCFGSHTLFRSAARFNINLAVLGAAAAIPLGLAAASGSAYPEAYASILALHKLLGISTLVCSITTAFILEVAIRKGTQKGIWIYRGLLLLCMGLVGATGHLGGQLVYGLEHFTW